MDEKTHINIITDTLVKKISVLDDLIILTKLQEEIFTAKPLDMESLNDTLSQKEQKIEQLNQLDNGFEKVYNRVREELSSKQMDYKNEILKLQGLIGEVMEKSTKLEIMEKRNKNQLTISFSSKRKEIKEYKMNSKAATSYYKNMADQHQGQSYFLDKKK